MGAKWRGWLLLVLFLTAVGCAIAGLVLWGQANEDHDREAMVNGFVQGLAGSSDVTPPADHTDSVILFSVAAGAVIALVVLRAGAKKAPPPEGSGAE